MALNLSPAFAQDNFPDVPDNHWAYEVLEVWMDHGVKTTLKKPGHLIGARPISRVQFALSTVEIVDQLDELLRLDLKRVTPGKNPVEANFFGHDIWVWFNRMTKVFGPEIKGLGRDPKKLRAQAFKSKPMALKLAGLYK